MTRRFTTIAPRVYVVSILMMVSTMLYSQSDPALTQYMYNNFFYNPGAAGSADEICLNATARQQWFGLDGAPQTTVFSANAPFNLFGINSGGGLNIYNEAIGFHNDLGFHGSYAYRMSIGDGSLGIGVSGGIVNRAFQSDWFTPEGAEDGSGTLPTDESVITFDMGFGIFYRAEDFYMGISSTHLLENFIEYKIAASDLDYHSRLYYLTSGYNLQLANPLFEIRPSFLIQSDLAISQFTFNTSVVYNKRLLVGVSYRNTESISALIGFEMRNGVRISYSYDVGINALQQYHDGSHEFSVGYCFKIETERAPKKYKSIRYL